MKINAMAPGAILRARQDRETQSRKWTEITMRQEARKFFLVERVRLKARLADVERALELTERQEGPPA